MSASPREVAASRRLYPSALSYLLLLLWLEAGYAVSLRLFTGVGWGRAAWQAAVCIAAIPPLLLIVINVIAGPKLAARLPRSVLSALWSAVDVAQFALPWLGWSALIWLTNGGGVPWQSALEAAGGIAVLSYLTGAALLLRFRPRAADVEVREVEIPLPGLPLAFDGYRILHISDVHCRSFLPPEAVAERLLPALSLRADLVVFTGDLSDEDAGRMEAAAALLSRLKAPDGIAAVLGNHDLWAGEKRVTAALRRHGVTVLVNEHRRLSRNGDELYLVGVNDSSYQDRSNLSAALDGVPESARVVLLSHAPAIVQNPLAQRASLVLSGHTHGGQVLLPRIGPVYVPSRLGRRYASGLYRIGDSVLFITSGLGEVIPPLRINCPPEVALLTLRRARAR